MKDHLPELANEIYETREALILNRKRWDFYITQLSALPPLLPTQSLAKIEERLCADSMRSQPPLDTEASVEVFYISPAGRNAYRETYYLPNGIEGMVRIIQQDREEAAIRENRQAVIARERAKMTSSLRYDVLRRDGFKCVLCGSSAQDGVKLEVDHIHPVSKGGKTELGNLRTLCDRCNRGKSNKLE